MKEFKKMLIWILCIITSLYILLSLFIYFNQEKLIFFPNKLPENYQFNFPVKFTERTIKTHDNHAIHGLLFHVAKPKGLIFYLHGNAGALDSWGSIAETYTQLNYDLFIFDYRGFGKSTGKIMNEEQFYKDVQAVYLDLAREYDESNIVIIGYSIGTGPATMLASRNHPKMLILQAPYYSLVDLARRLYPYIPSMGLKYKFNTAQFIKLVKAPIIIFHGEQDEVIYLRSSIKLKSLLKPGDKLFILKGQQHNGINENLQYLREIKRLL